MTNDMARGVGNPRPLKMEWDKVLNVRTIVLKAEKTFASLQKGVVPPLETTLEKMENASWESLPTYRFKEWSPDLSGLEFVITTVIPELPPNFVLEPPEQDEAIETVRCITADVLYEQYGIVAPPGDVCTPESNWWLLVTALDTSTPVQPTTLLLCLENLRTVVETTSTLCFLLTDYFRGKFSCQDWLRLIAMVLCRQSRIFLKDTQTQFRCAVLSTLSITGVT